MIWFDFAELCDGPRGKPRMRMGLVNLPVRPDDNRLTVSVETDKVTLEVPSPIAGVVQKLLVDRDDEVRTGEPLCTVLVDGADR